MFIAVQREAVNTVLVYRLYPSIDACRVYAVGTEDRAIPRGKQNVIGIRETVAARAVA
jgi:hypothetical protein